MKCDNKKEFKEAHVIYIYIYIIKYNNKKRFKSHYITKNTIKAIYIQRMRT